MLSLLPLFHSAALASSTRRLPGPSRDMGPLPPLERAAPGLCSSWSALLPRAAGLASPHPSLAALTLRPPSTFASTAVSPFLYRGGGSGNPPADSLVHVRPAPPTRCQSHEQGCPSGRLLCVLQSLGAWNGAWRTVVLAPADASLTSWPLRHILSVSHSPRRLPSYPLSYPSPPRGLRSED